MNTKDAIELMDTAVTFARILPDASSFRIANNVAKLARLGKEAHTHAERQCNEDLSDEYCSKKRASIASRAGKVLAEMGLSAAWVGKGDHKTRDVAIEVHGDPRGSCLQIEVKAPTERAPIRFRF